MSIDGARYIVEGVAAALMELFPQYADQVGDNLEAAAARLDELAGQMHAAAENAQGVRVILMNEALVYTAEELGLEIAGQYDHESGEPLYEGDADDCLAQLAAMDANVVLVEKQAPASLTDALEEAAISYRALMCSPRGARTWARRGTLRRRWKTRKRSRGFRAGGGQELKQVEIYTDGACSGNPGPGGWAAILIYRDKRAELSGYEAHTTNNRMERMAAIRRPARAQGAVCRAPVFGQHISCQRL